MIDHEPERDHERRDATEFEKQVAYKSIYRQLEDIRDSERLLEHKGEVLRSKRTLQFFDSRRTPSCLRLFQ